MSNKENIYKQLSAILDDMLLAIDNSNEKSFDYDSKFQKILIDNDIDFNYGIIKQIYYLVDMTYDSINHSFKEVNEGYSYNDVKNDLNYIISCIKNNNIKTGLEENKKFLLKLKSVVS